MALQGIKIPDNEQKKYSEIKKQSEKMDLSGFIMKNFAFRGPLEEVVRALQYIENAHGKKLDLRKFNTHYAQFYTSIDDPKLLTDFPVLKATGFVLDLNQYRHVQSASVIYKESGYPYPTQHKHITGYYTDVNPNDVRLRNDPPIAWPILKDPTGDFRTWYKNNNPMDPKNRDRITVNYKFPFRKVWNSEDYIFEKEDGFYRFDPNGRYIIEDHVLIGCEGVENSAGIPSDVKVIGKGAFKDNKQINRVTLPALTDIQEEAFSYCTNLRYIEFRKGLKRIGAEAFANCEHLTELIIPDSVVEIGTDAFFRCGVEKIVWPKGVKEIPAGMFKECRNLYEITIPPEVTKIGRRAFNRNNTIIVYCAAGSAAEEYARNNGMFVKEKEF